MLILRNLARDFQFLFPLTDHGQERFHWFVLTLQAILVPITVSRTSNLLRAIETLFGVRIAEWRYGQVWVRSFLFPSRPSDSTLLQSC